MIAVTFLKSQAMPYSREKSSKSGHSDLIKNPQVMKIEMQGNVSFQISGNVKEVEKEVFSVEDVNMVVEKTGKTKEEAIKALKESEGDIAEAIMALQS